MDFSSYSEHSEIIDFAKECCLPAAANELDIPNSAETPFALAFLAESMLALIDEKKGIANCLATARAVSCFTLLTKLDCIVSV